MAKRVLAAVFSIQSSIKFRNSHKRVLAVVYIFKFTRLCLSNDNFTNE